MKNIALIIEYDGSNFYGFQRQPTHARVATIQEALEHAIFCFTKEHVYCIAAGRTDTKVHGLYQVVSFNTMVDRPLHGWLKALNSFLPDSIVVREVCEVPSEFHARFHAISRTYHYYLQIANLPSAVLAGKVGFYYQHMDVDIVRQFLNYIKGEHDFSAFRASGCQARSAVKTMFDATVSCCNNDILRFTFTANSFLYHMIRNIMGMIVHLGSGRLSLEQCINIIRSCDRKHVPPTFMPDGLYLAFVDYGSFHPFTYKPNFIF